MKRINTALLQRSAWRRGISALAAVLVLAVLVGSMATLFILQGHGKNTANPGQPKNPSSTWVTAVATVTSEPLPTPGIYILYQSAQMQTQVSKLNPQTKKPVWTQQIGGGQTSVVVYGNTVYVSAWDSNTATNNDNFVYALDAATGAVRWKVLVNHDLVRGEDGSGPFDLGFLTAPVVDNGTVYVGARDGKFFALDAATGKQRWVYTAPAMGLVSDHVTINGQTHYNYTIYEGGPVVVDQGTVYGSIHNALFAVDAQTGKQRWVTKIDGKQLFNGPVLVNGTLYLTSYEASNHSNPSIETGYAYAYAPQDGRQIWRHSAGGWVLSPPTVDNGVVYLGSFNNNLYALRASDGSELWRYNTRGEIYDQPIVANGIVYTEESGNGSEATGPSTIRSALFAINATSGKLVWQKPIDLDSLQAVQDGVMYVTAYPGTLSGYSAKDGSLLWQRAYSSQWIVLTTLVS